MLNRTQSRCFLAAISLAVLTTGCGSTDTDSKVNPEVTVTPTPTATATATPAPSDSNLERFAVISGVSRSIDFDVANIADGFKAALNGAVATYIWKPPLTDYNSSKVILEWNSQVKVTDLKLFDNPQKGQQLTGGFVEYENSKDASLNFAPMNFSELPDDAATSLSVPGPGSPVTKVTIHFISHIGSDAGLAELYVMGSRVDEKIAEGNVAPYGHIGDIADAPGTMFSGVKSPTTNYQPIFVKDGKKTGSNDAGNSWVSDNNGGSAFIILEFDRPYSIKSVILYDRIETNVARVTGGSVRFVDANIKADFTKPKADTKVEVTPASPVKSTKIRVDISDFDGPSLDKYTGLAEIEVIGSYEP